MTEGNISSWKVKEGDSFTAGDVLLEIETDKASMDVEAQDDGVMAKIFAEDGSKGVKVGTRIAVIGEDGDDPSSLEIPPDDTKPVSKPKENVKQQEEEPEQKAPVSSKPSTESADPKGTPANPREQRSAPESSPSGPGQNTKYPFYPSVTALIHENHISDEDVKKIPATGPQNRLLKGDMLAYLGSIQSDYSSKQSKRIEHMGHLDLSNIKVVPSAPIPKTPTTDQAPSPEPSAVTATDIALPISLSEVLKVQKRIQDSLGVSMPISTFLARAVEIANDDLPVPKGALPSADDLFNEILGLEKAATVTRGSYIPQIAAMPSVPAARPRMQSMGRPDIIDILTSRAGAASPIRMAQAPALSASGGAMNVFSVTVPVGEEKRARVFLERMKTVLQVEPGRLVL